jgi:hypothetical protein
MALVTIGRAAAKAGIKYGATALKAYRIANKTKAARQPAMRQAILTEARSAMKKSRKLSKVAKTASFAKRKREKKVFKEIIKSGLGFGNDKKLIAASKKANFNNKLALKSAANSKTYKKVAVSLKAPLKAGNKLKRSKNSAVRLGNALSMNEEKIVLGGLGTALAGTIFADYKTKGLVTNSKTRKKEIKRFKGAIAKRKRKRMTAATKRKISQALKGKKRR